MPELWGSLSVLGSLILERQHREDGGVVIEYGVVVAVIAIGLAAVGTVLVSGVGDWFSHVGAYANTLGGL